MARVGGACLIAILAGACGGDDTSVDAELGMHTLSGFVRYEDRPQLATGRLGPIAPKPARGVQISVLTDDDGEMLGTGVTGEDGSYMFEYTRVVPAEPVHLIAVAISQSSMRPVVVQTRTHQVHAFGGPSFGNEALSQDLLITDSSGESEAFNVFDQLVINADAIRLDLGLTPARLVAVWDRGNPNGTFYSGNGIITLLGETSDDDGYDDTVILHEAGHFVEDSVGRSDNPGGFHDGSPNDPNLAWSEGFSTYWAMALIGRPFYGDSLGTSGWSQDSDSSITVAPEPTGDLGQDVAEGMITEILWDMGDSAPPDDDDLAGDQLAVRMVQHAYLRTAALRAVGENGVDLVDFLDGWFLADGLSHCAQVREIVTTVRGFPYDYDGPGGSCP